MRGQSEKMKLEELWKKDNEEQRNERKLKLKSRWAESPVISWFTEVTLSAFTQNRTANSVTNKDGDVLFID